MIKRERAAVPRRHEYQPTKLARGVTVGANTTIVCGAQSAVQPARHTALDTYSRAAFGPWPLPTATSRLGTLAPDVSAVVIVTGPLTTFGVLQRARAYLAPQVRLVAVQVVPGRPLSYREGSGIVVVTLGDLAELPLVLAGGVTV